MKKVFYFTSFFILIFNFNTFSKSLWDDKASNIYSRKINYAVGDSIQIIITEDSAVEYKTSTKALKTFKIDISGGEMSGVFNFLPKGDVEDNKNSQDSDRLKINSVISARIVQVNDNYVTVRGIKQVSVNNKTSSIDISGDASLQDINGKSILSSKLTNQSLRITTLIDNQNNVITANDLQTVAANPDSTTDKKQTTSLSDAKKRDLLLRYFNKLLNLIF